MPVSSKNASSMLNVIPAKTVIAENNIQNSNNARYFVLFRLFIFVYYFLNYPFFWIFYNLYT